MEAGDKSDADSHALRQQILQKPSNNPRHPSGLPFLRIVAGKALLVTDMRAEVDLDQLCNLFCEYGVSSIRVVGSDTLEIGVVGDLKEHKINIAHLLRDNLPGFPGIEYVRDDGSAYTFLMQGAPISAHNIVASFEMMQHAGLSFSDMQQLSFNNMHGHKSKISLEGDDELFEFALEDIDGNQMSIQATKGTTTHELCELVATKIGVSVDAIRLHLLGQFLIDQKRVVPQLASVDETVFYSFGYVEVELAGVSPSFHNLLADALPHVPLGYIWVRKEDSWHLMRNSMFPTVPVQLFSYDIGGKTSYNTWWLHQHHFTFFHTKNNNKPKRKYPDLDFRSKNNPQIKFMRGHLIDLVDGTSQTTLSAHNYIPEEGNEWGEHVRNYLVRDARKKQWAVAEWDLYNGKEEKTMDNNSVPTGRILMIFDANAVLQQAYFVPASFNDDKYRELVTWLSQAEEELKKSKQTVKYKFVASCLEIDLNLCVAPLVSVKGFKKQLHQDMHKLKSLTEIQTNLLLKLGNTSPVVEKALLERLQSTDSVQEHLLPAVKENLISNPHAIALLELRNIILNLLWIDFDAAWSVYRYMALQGEKAPISLANIAGDNRDRWRENCRLLNQELTFIQQEEDSSEEEEYEEYDDCNEDFDSDD